MKTLFLAWQAPEPTRGWYPIGRLDADLQREYYRFRYTHGARTAQRQTGLRPLVAFPEFERDYEAAELFPLFQNRVLSPSRRDFPEYLKWLDLDAQHSDPLSMLAVSGGTRATDNLEVFPEIHKDANGNFKLRFFLHGLRHVSAPGRERGQALQEGEELRMMVELNNPVTRLALALHTEDYHMVGWAPRYLVDDLTHHMAEMPNFEIRVVKNNGEGVPISRRILIELHGHADDDFRFMQSVDFRPLICDDHTVDKSDLGIEADASCSA